MDFIERLCDRINEIPSLPTVCKLGYLGANESLVLYPLPGSRIVQTYMNGATDQALNYEISMKSKSQKEISDTLWLIQNELEKMKRLNSHDNSFEFNELIVTSKPFGGLIDTQGWFELSINIQAKITVFKEEK